MSVNPNVMRNKLSKSMIETESKLLLMFGPISLQINTINLDKDSLKTSKELVCLVVEVLVSFGWESIALRKGKWLSNKFWQKILTKLIWNRYGLGLISLKKEGSPVKSLKITWELAIFVDFILTKSEQSILGFTMNYAMSLWVVLCLSSKVKMSTEKGTIG